MSIRVEINGDKAKLYTPYNSDFVTRIKRFGGAKWDGSCWTVPVDCVDAARSIMIDVYGENDLCSPDMVKVKLTFTEEVTSCCQDVSIMGKSISRAYGRDSGATPGQDVVFLKGEPTSGGSARNWDSVVTEGSVVILNHVPKPIYKKYMRHPHEGIEVELMGDETPDRQRLLSEKKSLLQRLAEVNRLLAELEDV